MLNSVFDPTIDRLARGLAWAARRHEVLAQNVANAETPGYRAQDVRFDALLASASDASAPVEPRPVAVADGAARPDGNDVHVERQMARLAENQLMHHALAQILAGQFTALKQAISGRV